MWSFAQRNGEPRPGETVMAWRFFVDGSTSGRSRLAFTLAAMARVEAALSRVGGERVLRAAVIAVPSRARADRLELAAYVVPRDPSLDPSALRTMISVSRDAARANSSSATVQQTTPTSITMKR